MCLLCCCLRKIHRSFGQLPSRFVNDARWQLTLISHLLGLHGSNWTWNWQICKFYIFRVLIIWTQILVPIGFEITFSNRPNLHLTFYLRMWFFLTHQQISVPMLYLWPKFGWNPSWHVEDVAKCYVTANRQQQQWKKWVLCVFSAKAADTRISLWHC